MHNSQLSGGAAEAASKGFQSDTFLTQEETAKLLKLSSRTLERWRLSGEGIPFVKAGRRILYARHAIEKWAMANTHQSTSEAINHL